MPLSAQNITVGTTAVKLVHASDENTIVKFTTAGSIWWGPTSSVTVGTSGTTNTTGVNGGLILPSGTNGPLLLRTGDEVWAISSSSADVAVIVTS